MSNQRLFRFHWVLSVLLIVSVLAGCAGGNAAEPATAPPATPEAATTVAEATEIPATPIQKQVVDENVLYEDGFANPASGWPEEKFDNYFIGYHEPEYYHVEITSPNYKTTVFEPTKQSFSDTTVEVKVFTNSKKTAATGDFNYGLVFRRSGDQYYAFTVSPRAKKWFLLKSSPNALTVLAEGTDENIHELDVEDILHVDAQGSNFAFYINDQQVGQGSDPDYANGEIGFYVQTFDAANVHIHFEAISIKKLAASQAVDVGMIYKDDFANPASGWAEKKFDNYFIGYHEPEYYHIEITSSNYKTTVFEPTKQNIGDATVETKVFTNSKKTSATGDFIYGSVFRRSGDQYYAFTISPRAKKWFLLKSSPNALVILAEGTEAGINELDTEDILRVDAEGPEFSLHINDKLVGQVTDPDYVSGEIGFYVQTFDAANIHIHYESIAIKNFDAPLACDVNALALNVRRGPGTSFGSFTVLYKGDTFIPSARSSDDKWLKLTLADTSDQGWVANSPDYIACTGALDSLPADTP